jgi:F1F0 ATPase subunit 2
MARPIGITALFLAGAGLGIVFFGGLWLTVRALPTARYPTALALASFWGRTALVVASFTLAFSGGWQNVLSCLLGFITARLLLSRWTPSRNATRKTAG